MGKVQLITVIQALTGLPYSSKGNISSTILQNSEQSATKYSARSNISTGPHEWARSSMYFPLWHPVIWSCLLSEGVWSDWNWKEKYLIFLNSQTFKVQPVPWILRMQLEVFKQDLYWCPGQALQTKHPQSNKHLIHQIWLRLLTFFFLSHRYCSDS